jgi:tetratricopeptide (TPR) repeat protein
VGATMEEKPEDRQGQSERLQQAAVYYKLGKFLDALELLDELARERPDSRHVLYSQGMCLAAVGHVDEARRICERLHEFKGHTAASMTFKLRARLEDLENKNRKPPRRTTRVMVKGLLRMARRPKGILLCAVLFTGSVFGISALRGESVEDDRAGYRPVAYAAQPVEAKNVDGAYLEIPASYLAGKEEPVKYAIVFCPSPEIDGRTDKMDDSIGAQAAENWAELRAQAEEALAMAVQQPAADAEKPQQALARVAVIPREGLALAGGLRGKTVERFKPGDAKTLRALAIAAGPPDAIALWPDGIALTGIEGDICWWGRLGVATDDNGAVTHLAIIGLPAENVPVPEIENPEAAADSEPGASSN